MNVKLKRFLHKFFKAFIILMLSILVINLLILGIVYANHTSKKKKEDIYMIPPGKMVEVNGHYLHVLESGNPDGEYTLVFMHNAAVVDDAIALGPLFEELSEYRLVLVERSGTGFSDNSDVDRDIDTLLEETRQALTGAGIPGPYILVPNGSAGVEAVYWSIQHPEEVEAVIGINMNYPEQFADVLAEDYAGFFDYLMVMFCNVGGLRLVKAIYPSNDYGIYTAMEMNIRNALISQRGYTMDIFNEREQTVGNADKVASLGWPEDTQMYMIYCNPLMEPYINDNIELKEQYEKAREDAEDVDFVGAYNAELIQYFAQYENVTVDEVDGPARLYLYDPSGQAELMKNYIENCLE